MMNMRRFTNRKNTYFKRGIVYSSITVALTCLFVLGYYLISNGVIFGKYTSPEPYIQQEYINDPDKALTIPEESLVVTAKSNTVPVLTASPSLNLPEIPKTDGKTQKGTKENPLVVLEIVPELAQQSLSYLVSTKEEGAPFNSALEMGMDISKDKNRPFVTRGSYTFNGVNGNVNIPNDTFQTNIVNTCLNDLGAWFDNNNNGGYTIYNPDGTVYGARKTKGEDDRASAPWAYMGIHYTITKMFDKESELADATDFATNMYQRKDAGGKSVSELHSSDPEFRDDSGESIPKKVLENEDNWARTVSDCEKYIEVDSKVMTEPAFEDDFDKIKNGMSVKEFAQKYPLLFEKYTSVNYSATEEEMKVSESELANDNKWKAEKIIGDVYGYFLYVGTGKGDYRFINAYNPPEYVGDNAGSYIYVEELPEIPNVQSGYFLYRGAGKGDFDIAGVDNVTYNQGKGSYSFEPVLSEGSMQLTSGYLLYKGAGKGKFNIDVYNGISVDSNGKYDFVFELPEGAQNRWPDDYQNWQVANENAKYETDEYIDKAYFSINKFSNMGNKEWMKKVEPQNIWKDGMDASDVFDSQKNTLFNNDAYAGFAYFSITKFKNNDWKRYVTYQNIWPDGMEQWKVADKNFNPVYDNESYINYSYIPVYKFPSGDWIKVAKPKKDISYKLTYRNDSMCVFKFQYIGLKTNDILKRMFFWYEDDVDSNGEVTKTADEKYDETYIKVIALTPAMINQMDKNDTEGTLDYIERADGYFISSYSGDSVADGIDKLVDLYYKYLDPERDTDPKTYSKENMATFYENDLEWVDCMKIIKRLSQDCNLPMMFSKQLGYMLDEGVKRDGTKTTHMYLNDKWQCNSYAGSLNNLAKLYLITTQFDLSAIKGKQSNGITFESTFMDDIFGNIKQVPLNLPSGSSVDKNTAQYTGFYQRLQLAGCSDADLVTKQNCYYLWNIATFIPTMSVGMENSVFGGDNGKTINVEALLKYGFLRTSITNQQYHDSIINGGGDYGKITGTRDPENDLQNVTIGGNDQSANTNFVIYNGGMMGAMGKIWYEIMNNGKPLNPTMAFSVISSEKTKKYYQKISDKSVLLDYVQNAKYRQPENKWINIYCKLDNQNNEETSVITSVKLYNPDAYDESGNLKDNEYDGDGNLVKEYRNAVEIELFEDSGAKIGKGNITGNKDGVKEYDNNLIDFSGNQNRYAPVAGYAVPRNGVLMFVAKIKLSDWLNLNGGVKRGNTVLRVEWVSRTSRNKTGSYIPYQNPMDPTNKDEREASHQFAEVTIGERGLFDLQ